MMKMTALIFGRACVPHAQPTPDAAIALMISLPAALPAILPGHSQPISILLAIGHTPAAAADLAGRRRGRRQDDIDFTNDGHAMADACRHFASAAAMPTARRRVIISRHASGHRATPPAARLVGQAGEEDARCHDARALMATCLIFRPADGAAASFAISSFRAHRGRGHYNDTCTSFFTAGR